MPSFEISTQNYDKIINEIAAFVNQKKIQQTNCIINNQKQKTSHVKSRSSYFPPII